MKEVEIYTLDNGNDEDLKTLIAAGQRRKGGYLSYPRRI
jgi:hypothetical protein